MIAALVLSIASQALKERQQLNVEIDMKRNILSAVELLKDGACTGNSDAAKDAPCGISCCYNNNISSFLVDYRGNVIKNDSLVPEGISIEAELDKPEKDRKYPVFIRTEKGSLSAYCIPIIGKGLWSTLYGYLALETDLVTVKGVTFYKHGETPGLGAEIEKSWFLNNYKGKKILDAKGALCPIKTVKGAVLKTSPTAMHEVDGISGATLTCNGVNDLIKAGLERYEPYFNATRRKR